MVEPVSEEDDDDKLSFVAEGQDTEKLARDAALSVGMTRSGRAGEATVRATSTAAGRTTSRKRTGNLEIPGDQAAKRPTSGTIS